MDHLRDGGSEASPVTHRAWCCATQNWRGLCGAVARSASRLCSQGARGLSFNSSIPPRHGLTALAAARAPGRSWPKVTPELLGIPAPRTFGEEGSGSPSENPFLIQQQEKRIFSYFSNDRKSHLGSSHLHRAPPKSPHPLLALPLPAQAASRTLGCTPDARGHPQTPKGAQITSPRITFPLLTASRGELLQFCLSTGWETRSERAGLLQEAGRGKQAGQRGFVRRDRGEPGLHGN